MGQCNTLSHRLSPASLKTWVRKGLSESAFNLDTVTPCSVPGLFSFRSGPGEEAVWSERRGGHQKAGQRTPGSHKLRYGSSLTKGKDWPTNSWWHRAPDIQVAKSYPYFSKCPQVPGNFDFFVSVILFQNPWLLKSPGSVRPFFQHQIPKVFFMFQAGVCFICTKTYRESNPVGDLHISVEYDKIKCQMLFQKVVKKNYRFSQRSSVETFHSPQLQNNHNPPKYI